MKIVVCIAKDEPHINEWIDYHLALGFDRIVIYANDWIFSSANPNVHVMQWSGVAQQFNCYNHALRTQIFDWAAFIDCDEYITCREGLNKFLHNRSQSVAMPWRIYGNREQQGATVVERFRWWAYDSEGHVKTLVKHTADLRVQFFDNPHFLRGAQTQTPDKSSHRGPFTKELPDKLYIRHYYYQDEAYWNKKIARGRADNGAKRTEKWQDGYKFNQFYEEDQKHI
jgi:hypothetical protein